jgi:hypothetical protein
MALAMVRVRCIDRHHEGAHAGAREAVLVRTPAFVLACAACAFALCALLAVAPGARGATPTTRRPVAPPTFTIPASARVHGASTAPASTVPAVPATATAAPAGGAITTPAAIAPTTPATAVPPTTTVPASRAAATPLAAGGATAARHRGGSTHLSTGALIAAALAALLIVLCVAWALARWFAYEPRWSVSLRHALAEAGWRLSASWDEFADWARIGR